MKCVGIQGIFTREDLMELVDIFAQKGAYYGLLSYGDKTYKSVDTTIPAQHINQNASGIWLNTSPFNGLLTSRSNIGHEFPGCFRISFNGCEVTDGEIGESAIGSISPADGDQLKIWESGLRFWKKRLVRDVHIYSRKIDKAFPNEKMNVSQKAIAGYERGDWKLVNCYPGIGADLIHPLVAQKEVPFPI
jgi:hypothetical protein